MQLFYAPQLAQNQLFLDEEESRHCIKVLRKQQGDIIDCIDGVGHFYECEITDAHHKKCALKIIKTRAEKKSTIHLHIAIAPTKNLDRIEWFVEKAVEIGIEEISFIRCQNSERVQLKTDRIIKKAIAAMKQSIKVRLPIINELVSFADFIKNESKKNSHKLIAYVDFENPNHLKD